MAVSLARTLAPARARVNGHGVGDGWRIDEQALIRACERLGLTRPVVAHVARGRGGRSKWGHHSTNERGEHVIGVLAGASAVTASRTLWHELEHACQLEAMPGFYNREYRAETRAVGYEHNRFEVAARRAERRHEVWFALTSA